MERTDAQTPTSQIYLSPTSDQADSRRHLHAQTLTNDSSPPPTRRFNSSADVSLHPALRSTFLALWLGSLYQHELRASQVLGQSSHKWGNEYALSLSPEPAGKRVRIKSTQSQNLKSHFSFQPARRQGRFTSRALLTEKALMAAMTYVDLNPIRADIATSVSTSRYTSVKRRVKALRKDPVLADQVMKLLC